MRLTGLILAAGLAVPSGAMAATTFFDEAEFMAAIGDADVVTAGFVGVPNGEITGTTVFPSGIMVLPNAPSADNFVTDGVLRLSVDNTGAGAETPADPLTASLDVMLPNPASFFAFEFGDPVEGSRPSGRGIGNDSGTTLTAGGFSYDFSAMFGADPGYTGFFGVIGDDDETFQTITFSSNGIGARTDDDFTVETILFEAAPIPLPAGLPLLAGGVLAFAALRRRRKG